MKVGVRESGRFVTSRVTEGKCVVASGLLVGLVICFLAEKGSGGKGRTSFQDLLRSRGHMQLHNFRHGLTELS